MAGLEAARRRQEALRGRDEPGTTVPPRTDPPAASSNRLAVVRAASAATPNTILVQRVTVTAPAVDGDAPTFTPEVDADGANKTFTIALWPFTFWYEWKKYIWLPDALAFGVMLIPYRDYGGVLLPEPLILWDEYQTDPVYSTDDCLPPAPNTEIDG